MLGYIIRRVLYMIPVMFAVSILSFFLAELAPGEVAEVHHEGDVCDIRIRVPKEWMNYIFVKGFIAVDGASMTVGEIDRAGSFDLHLIPETLRLTNLGKKAPGDRVNIELDARTVAIVDTVERILDERFARERAADSGS